MKPNQKVYQVIFNKIKDSIMQGELLPGEKLPSERELANRYNVSRTSIREALRVLEMNGVVEIRQGDGTFIKASNVNAVVESLSDVIINTEDTLIYEMLETRLVLESECAYFAALRATSRDIEKIGRCIEDMRVADKDTERGVLADLQFHYSIAEAAHNSVLLGLVQTLGGHMKKTIQATRNHRFARDGLYEETFNEHRDLFLAISRRDADGAKQLMIQHITKIRQEMSEVALENYHQQEE
ncbi:FadR/GntR family transcriptional regulator [Lysinibacillus sp. LZ02]|uniref:FadR/GntR family transcriptional regulator n=1 Tax=Lysinibacillus sp. LZ02 TaxID=3420668 RepID=UPI003D3656BB